jgi:hypothetical protein
MRWLGIVGMTVTVMCLLLLVAAFIAAVFFGWPS